MTITVVPCNRMPLTPTQANVLRFIQGHIATEQCPPTRAEIARAFGWASGNAAEDHLRALVRKGWVRVVRQRPRGIFVL